jgi:hypothetical protein
MAMSTSRCFSRALSLVTVSLTAFVFATCAPSDTGPSPQPTGLRFANASAVLLIGAMQQFTPLLVFQDGSTQPAPSATTWRSADPSVAIVDAFGTGLVTGRMNGVTSILATYGNFTATLNLRVAPNYGGAWNGRFTPTKCGRVAAFSLSNFCSAIATPQDLQLSLTQAGLMATGTMTLFGAQGPVTATIDDDGALEVMGAVNPSSGNSKLRRCCGELADNGARELDGGHVFDAVDDAWRAGHQRRIRRRRAIPDAKPGWNRDYGRALRATVGCQRVVRREAKAPGRGRLWEFR